MDCDDIDWRFDVLSGSRRQSQMSSSESLGLMTTSAKFVETPVNVTKNNPSQHYTHPYYHTLNTDLWYDSSLKVVYYTMIAFHKV